MSWWALGIYYGCVLGGLVMLVGGIWLIYREKIYVDAKTNTVTEIKTPVGTFKTNVPAIGLFALGFVGLIYPIYSVTQFTKEISRHVTIRGRVTSQAHPVTVFAVSKGEALLSDRDFSLQVPCSDESYKVVYVLGNMVFEDFVDPHKQKGDEINLTPKVISQESQHYEPELAAVPEEFQ